jgi:hypothetical protein
MASFGLTAVFAMLGWAMADRSGAQEQDRCRLNQLPSNAARG